MPQKIIIHFHFAFAVHPKYFQIMSPLKGATHWRQRQRQQAPAASQAPENPEGDFFWFHIMCFTVAWPRYQEKLREAAKARLRRMMAVHAKKTALNVPEWVREQWKSKDQNTMAQILMDANWDKDWFSEYLYNSNFLADPRLQEAFITQLEIVVKKKNMQTIWVDEQWCSEKEMKDDLKWTPSLVSNMLSHII